MTIAELVRAVESKQRLKKQQLKEKAVFDYNLANLIGVSISRVYSKNNKYPSIEEAYPALFSSEEVEEAKEQQKIEQSVINFRNFADNFNTRFKGGLLIKDE